MRTDMKLQKTLRQDVVINGIGLHSGSETVMRVRPSGPNTGIIFVRTDVTDRNNKIVAMWDAVVDTRLCTVIGNDAGVTVGTIEHVMAALSGMEISNAIIELDSPEVPILDGSSEIFIQAFEEVGLMMQGMPARAIKVLREVSVKDGDKVVSFSPSDEMIFEGEIDFAHQSIGRQSYRMTASAGAFQQELSNARTFGFVEEVNALRKMGLCLGGSTDNAIVLDQDKILNVEGLRSENEFIRHKLLDAIGDIYLAGMQVMGHYHGYKGGHTMNNALLHELFSDEKNWCYVDMDLSGAMIAPAGIEMSNAA